MPQAPRNILFSLQKCLYTICKQLKNCLQFAIAVAVAVAVDVAVAAGNDAEAYQKLKRRTVKKSNKNPLKMQNFHLTTPLAGICERTSIKVQILKSKRHLKDSYFPKQAIKDRVSPFDRNESHRRSISKSLMLGFQLALMEYGWNCQPYNRHMYDIRCYIDIKNWPWCAWKLRACLVAPWLVCHQSSRWALLPELISHRGQILIENGKVPTTLFKITRFLNWQCADLEFTFKWVAEFMYPILCNLDLILFLRWISPGYWKKVFQQS